MYIRTPPSSSDWRAFQALNHANIERLLHHHNTPKHPLTLSLAARACAGALCGRVLAHYALGTPSRRTFALSTVSTPPSLALAPLT